MLEHYSLENVLLLVGSGALWTGVVATVVVYARRMLRAVERRSVAEAEVAALTARVQQLEAQLERVADDTQRLDEDQRFTRQLLVERPAALRGAAPHDA